MRTENRGTSHGSHHFEQSIGHLAGGGGDADAGGLEGGDLGFGGAFATAHNGAGVTHTTSGRGRGASEESGGGFLAILFDPLGGFFLGAATDFTDHDDAMRFGIGVEQLDDIE